MRKAHRRAHFLMWLAIAPATLGALIVALAARPSEPKSDIPAAIAAEAP